MLFDKHFSGVIEYAQYLARRKWRGKCTAVRHDNCGDVTLTTLALRVSMPQPLAKLFRVHIYIYTRAGSADIPHSAGQKDDVYRELARPA